MCSALAPSASVVVLRNLAIDSGLEVKGLERRRSVRRVVLLRRQASIRSSRGVAPVSSAMVVVSDIWSVEEVGAVEQERSLLLEKR